MKTEETNERLRALMQAHDLRIADVARLCRVALRSAEAWLQRPDSATYRNMSARSLALLELQLQAPR